MNSKFINKKSEIDSIINECDVCYMSMVTDEGLPYVIPFNFAYENDVLFFHSAPIGLKIDYLKKKPEVCIVFSTGHQLHHHNAEVGCSYSMKFRSVVVYGKVKFVEDIETKTVMMNKIMQKYTGRDFTYSLPAIKNVAVFYVEIEKITGKKRGY